MRLQFNGFLKGKKVANNQSASRLWNLISGFIALFVTNVEKQNPEIAYQNAIVSLTEKYAKLKAATGRIIARRLDVEERERQARTDLADVERQLNAAVATNQDDLAVLLIQKKQALAEALTELTRDLQEAQAEADEAKSSLLSLKGEIDKLKGEKDRQLARFESASARLKIQESLDGLSVDAEVQALAGVREHIKGKVAEAKLGSELRSSDLDVRLKSLTASAGAVTARAELEAMKQQRAAVAAGTKTL